MRARGAPPAEWGRGERWIFRYRRHLIPFAVVLGLADLEVLVFRDVDWPLLGAGLLIAGWLAWRQRWRGRIEIVGGSLWPWRWSRWRFRVHSRRTLRQAIKEWPRVARRANVDGVTVRRALADWDDPSYTLYLDLHGLIDEDLQRNDRRIASGLRAKAFSIEIEAEAHEHEATLRWARDDRWADFEELEPPVELHLLEQEAM